MFSTLVNAWKIKDIRTKMLYTMLLIVIYRLGSFIPVPGVNAAAITQYAEQYDMLGFLNLLSGGAFGDFSIFAMGISPYITGSIIIHRHRPCAGAEHRYRCRTSEQQLRRKCACKHR